MKNTFVITILLLFFLSCSNKKTGSDSISDSSSEQTAQHSPTATEERTPEVQEEPAMDEKETTESEGTSDTGTSNANVAHYICYTDNDVATRKIWISFTDAGKALQVKYKGQTEAMTLRFDDEEVATDGTNPVTTQYYSEIYDGQKNGTYKLTHSGVWDYVEYTRGKDSKKFNFTIDHNANPYGKTPCFE